MNLQEFKDSFATSKGFKDFANMTITTLVTNEDWIGYDNLINEMMKLFAHVCYCRTEIEYEVNPINKDLFDYTNETDHESGVTYYIRPLVIN